MSKRGKTAFECVFIDNMHECLDYTLNDPEFRTICGDDPNLSVNSENIELLFSHAIKYQAEECFQILLDYQVKH